MGWQRGVLLDNPRFADPDDPRHEDIRRMDFKNLLKEAMKLEIAEQRGDWQPVTQTDAVEFANNLAMPAGFEEAEEPEPPVVVVWEDQVRGTGGRMYRVVLANVGGEHVWHCTCPAFEYNRAGPEGCKHILDAKRRRGDPVEPPEEPERPVPQPQPPARREGPRRRVSPEKWRSAAEHGTVPNMRNTRFPSEGVMLDGSEPPPPPEPVDPWAPKTPPPAEGTVIRPGATIVLGGDDEE